MNICLKNIREKHGITQSALAKKLGVAPAYISRVECGKQQLSMAIALDIADYFSVPLDDLFGRKVNDRKEK